MKKIIRTFVLLTIMLTTGIILKTHVAAENFIVTNHDITIQIQENGSARFNATLTIQNNDSEHLIGGYQYVLPVQKPFNVTVLLDGNPITAPVYSLENTRFSKIDIQFNELALRPATQKTLTITGLLPSFVLKRDNTSFVLLQNTGDITSYTITYPNSFGTPVFISGETYEFQEEQTQQRITFREQSPALIIWGDSYTIDVETAITLKNTDSETAQALVPLIPEYNSQTVIYKTVKDGIFGLRDSIGNIFAHIAIPGDFEMKSGFEAQVTKTMQQLLPLTTDAYNLSWQTTINFESVHSNALDNLRFLHDELITQRPLEFTTTQSQSDWQDDWETLQNKTTFNSFDYCFVLTAFAESQNMKAEIRYGYVVIPDFNTSQIQPHVWCLFTNDQKTFMVDPYMEQISQVRYFGTTADLDRITMGIWQPKQTYNTALGLIGNSENNTVQTITLTDLGVIDTSTQTILAQTVANENQPVISGKSFSTTVDLYNPNPYLFPIQSVRMNDTETTVHDFSENFSYVLLPGRNNRIVFSEFPSQHIFVQGTKTNEYSVLLQQYPNQIIFSEQREFNVNSLLIIGALIAACTPILILILYRSRK